MCGIVGYIGQRAAAGLLIEGLERLEYRGYDSAGVAVLDAEQKTLHVIKRQGKVATTAAAVHQDRPIGKSGIAHTRWATHGQPSDRNAHPHADCAGTVAVVHNGQLTNYQALKQQLLAQGHRFQSDTDTEVLAHLLEDFRSSGDSLVSAVQKTTSLIEGGTYAIVAIDAASPETLVAACMGSPLYIGIAADGLFLASDHRAFRAHTDRSVQLHDGQIAVINADRTYRVLTFGNEPVSHDIQRLKYQLEDIEKGTYGTFMEKEIFEQPDVVRRVLDGRASADGRIRLGGIEAFPGFQTFVRQQLHDVLILGCGTSLFAGEAITRFFQEHGYEAQAIDAAEFATSSIPVKPSTLVIPISQSGTTADLLVAMERVKAAGAASFALVNVPGSKLTSYGTGMYLHAGPETGVASTKAFTAQVLSGSLLVLALAQEGRLNAPHVEAFCSRAAGLADALTTILRDAEMYRDIGQSLRDVPRMLYIGRGYGLAVAKEGALKMMEIARIPSLGMSAAAMKHGPIALVDDATAVVAICLRDPKIPELYELTLSNVEQVLARKGRVIVVAEAGDDRVATLGPRGQHPEQVVFIPPAHYGVLSAITSVVPLQLIALSAAAARGLNVDQPVNLAKSVTVL